jgi:hypothetical protein
MLLAAPAVAELDPMRPPVDASRPAVERPAIDEGRWQLNLIKDRDGMRIAMINGRLVSEGAQVDGARVRSIDDRRVLLQLNNERILKLVLPSVRLRKGDR